MTIIAALSLLALIASNAVWARYLRILDEENRKERDKLLTRIQAPELATIPEIEVKRSHVGFDDDEGYWQAREEAEAA